MSLRSWFRGAPSNSSSKEASEAPSVNTSSETTSIANGSATELVTPAAAREVADLQDAMAATDLIMNDDNDGAEARLRLKQDASTFHSLGLGVSTFMRGVLGVEKEMMAEAASRLNSCENQAWNDMKKAQKEAERAASGGGYWLSRGSTANASKENIGGKISKIYPPGSEFALVHAEAQLMNAVLAVTQESLTEGVKGFYKMRKAYITLNEIAMAEAKYLRTLENGDTSSAPTGISTEKILETSDAVNAASTQVDDEKREENAESTDAAGLEKSMSAVSLNGSAQNASLDQLNTSGADISIFSSPVDAFIHSGNNMCFGILNLMLGMIPPAFSRLLQIIGFKGDRERGLEMLWQSTKYRDVNGAMAGLVLLTYYNGMVGLSEILPSEADISELAAPGEAIGYPKEQCAALLAEMRSRYPDSGLWKLEEARVVAGKKRLDEAIDILVNNADSKMRQVTALNTFELSLNSMLAMRWELMRDNFLKCMELNDWSHALYYFFAGCAELELYRDAFHRAVALTESPEGSREAEAVQADAKKHKKAAEEFFRKVPTVAGRKRFMARKMPFEVFACRKLQKWEERATALDLDLADAIGASPAMEMSYMWTGPKRMGPELLEKGRSLVRWERCTAPADKLEKIREEQDEVAIAAVVDAAFLRGLGRESEAKALAAKIVAMEKTAFKGPTRDDYILPAAHYEMAIVSWIEAHKPPPDTPADSAEAHRRGKINECQSYLQQVASWETFVLDARFGMRVQTGLNTVEWLKGKKGWA